MQRFKHGAQCFPVILSFRLVQGTQQPTHLLARRLPQPSPLAMAAQIWRKAPMEHCGKCGGRARQPRGPLTGCLWEGAHSLCLPRQSHTAPFKRFPPAPLPSAHPGHTRPQGAVLHAPPLRPARIAAAKKGSMERTHIQVRANCSSLKSSSSVVDHNRVVYDVLRFRLVGLVSPRPTPLRPCASASKLSCLNASDMATSSVRQAAHPEFFGYCMCGARRFKGLK